MDETIRCTVCGEVLDGWEGHICSSEYINWDKTRPDCESPRVDEMITIKRSTLVNMAKASNLMSKNMILYFEILNKHRDVLDGLDFVSETNIGENNKRVREYLDLVKMDLS